MPSATPCAAGASPSPLQRHVEPALTRAVAGRSADRPAGGAGRSTGWLSAIDGAGLWLGRTITVWATGGRLAD